MTPVYTSRFKKDLRLASSRQKNMDKIKAIITALLDGKVLPQKLRDHSLTGNYQGRRECHIEFDWLLIYKLDGDRIIFERTGSHADLF
ncbi:MAG: type II toxin-antitoxin system YafQ family toxin [Gammaproteobacteria bacterium]